MNDPYPNDQDNNRGTSAFGLNDFHKWSGDNRHTAAHEIRGSSLFENVIKDRSQSRGKYNNIFENQLSKNSRHTKLRES